MPDNPTRPDEPLEADAAVATPAFGPWLVRRHREAMMAAVALLLTVGVVAALDDPFDDFGRPGGSSDRYFVEEPPFFGDDSGLPPELEEFEPPIPTPEMRGEIREEIEENLGPPPAGVPRHVFPTDEPIEVFPESEAPDEPGEPDFPEYSPPSFEDPYGAEQP